MKEPDCVEALTYAIERLEQALRNRRLMQGRQRVALKMIEKLKDMRALLLHEASRMLH